MCTIVGWQDRPVTGTRRVLLDRLADALASLPPTRPQRVAIDGVDGAGKTMLADEVAELMDGRRPVVRASVDGFHRPRAARYTRGRDSPEGYYLDSYDYAALFSVLLDPFAIGEPVCTAVWDHVADAPVPRRWHRVGADAILIIDGIFLHRPELRDAWAASVFCRVTLDTAYARMAERDGASADPADPANRRYVEGQRLYIAACDPEAHATYVVDNTDLAAPYLVGR
jgi:uridine kinase